MTLECWDTKLWLFPKWTTPQCDPARMKGYIKLWPVSGCITMSLAWRAEPTNKHRRQQASKLTIVTACAAAPAGSARLSPAIQLWGVNSARLCTPVRTHVVLAWWTEHGRMWADVFYFTGEEEQNISMALQLLFLPPLLDYKVIR
jgi:hypothetical protein